MKTLSRRFWFVVFGVIVIVAVGSCCCLPLIPDTKIVTTAAGSYIELGHELEGGERTYVPWKSKDNFDSALQQVCNHHGTYCIKVKPDDKSKPIPYGSKDCTDCRRENIRTVKVTKSKVADDATAGESAVNDPNAFYRVRSPDPGDLKKVLDALATPTPTPTH